MGQLDDAAGATALLHAPMGTILGTVARQGPGRHFQTPRMSIHHLPTRALRGAALVAVVLAAALPAAAAAQERQAPLRFPDLRPLSLATGTTPDLRPLRSRAAADPMDPAPLGPPPPHHTRTAVLWTAGVSVAAFGALLLLPEDITGWSADDRSWNGVRDEWNDFKRHVTRLPVWDNDSFFFNYIGHPYVGMHTYLMERNYGMSPLRSFLFSTAASFAFEYVVEAWAEPPSAQDLLTTSPIGSILGELNYRLTHHLRRGGLTFAEKAVITVVNPLHVLQHGHR